MEILLYYYANLFDILLFFCIQTWPSHHVSENTIVIHVKHESLHTLSALQIDGGRFTRFDQFSILHVLGVTLVQPSLQQRKLPVFSKSSEMKLLCRIYDKSSRFESTEFKSYSVFVPKYCGCLLYTSPSPRDA